MSFEVFVIAADDSRAQPRKSDLLNAFEGHVLALPGVYLIVGSEDGPQCEISGDWGPDTDPEQALITFREPFPAPWLWEGVLDLLRNFDVFLMVPDAPSAWGAVARTDATIPPDVRDSYGFVQVASAQDLISAFQTPPEIPLT